MGSCSGKPGGCEQEENIANSVKAQEDFINRLESTRGELSRKVKANREAFRAVHNLGGGGGNKYKKRKKDKTKKKKIKTKKKKNKTKKIKTKKIKTKKRHYKKNKYKRI